MMLLPLQHVASEVPQLKGKFAFSFPLPNLFAYQPSKTCPGIPTPPNSPLSNRQGRARCNTVMSSGQSDIASRRPHSFEENAAATAIPLSKVNDDDIPEGCVKLTLLGVTRIVNARFLLFLVPMLWGSFPPVGKWLYKLPWSLNPAVFNALRLGISALVVAPITIREFAKAMREGGEEHRKLLRAGAELGFWTFLGSTLQLLGVKYTTASRAAFLTQLQTVMVPIMACAFGIGSALTWHVWAASVLALSGVGLLTLDDVAQGFTFRGDGFMVLTALASAIFVLRTRITATKLRSAPLVSYKVTFQMIFSMLFMFMYQRGRQLSGAVSMFAAATPALIILNIALVIWAGACISAMSTWLQIKGSTVVPAPETAIIFSFTPMWACALAMLLGERFGLRGIIGGAMILISTILSSRKPKHKLSPVLVKDTASVE